jgi:hypothetical protein
MCTSTKEHQLFTIEVLLLPCIKICLRHDTFKGIKFKHTFTSALFLQKGAGTHMHTCSFQLLNQMTKKKMVCSTLHYIFGTKNFLYIDQCHYFFKNVINLLLVRLLNWKKCAGIVYCYIPPERKHCNIHNFTGFLGISLESA